MVLELMEYFGVYPLSQNNEYIIFPAICHSSDSPKLYYYPSTNSWNCWSHCGGVDILSITQEVMGLSFQDSIKWLTDFFKLNNRKRGFGNRPKIERKPIEIKKKTVDLKERLYVYQDNILNTFHNIPITEWLKEGISFQTMQTFEIKYDINSHGIIIPCRDINNELIGIRVRNLNENTIEKYGKYGIYIDLLNGISYKFSSGKILYGLNINKRKIIERKKIIIVEGEKSVLKSKTWFGDDDITVSSFGCNLTDYQIELIKSLNVKEIVFMYDKEDDDKILRKMEKIYKKCSLFFDVYYVNDYKRLINVKDSPLDKGKDIYREIFKKIEKYELKINN